MKNILLTGASGGIGKAIVTELLKVDGDIQFYGLSRRNAEIQHDNYHPVICDFRDPKQTEVIAKHLRREIEHIDAIILAAGFGKFSGLEQYSLDDMQAMLNVNFFSQAVLIKTFLPLLKTTANSKIIAIASEAALQGAKKGAMYCATKFALRGFLQSLRAECSQTNTAVTLVNPGLVRTEFFNGLDFEPGAATENYIQAEQVAKTIAFILQMENNCVLEEINLQPMKKVIQKNINFPATQKNQLSNKNSPHQ